jgi:hypothetical protein
MKNSFIICTFPVIILGLLIMNSEIREIRSIHRRNGEC